MTDVHVSTAVLRWAAQRARLRDDELEKRFRKWRQWLNAEAMPTLKQLEAFAHQTHTPIGYFFLPEPPELVLPIPDFRTFNNESLTEPSSNLLDMLYLCQQRQDWYRDYARLHGLAPLIFVGSVRLQDAPEDVAQRIRKTLGLSSEERRQAPTWEDALRQLIAKAEDAGVLVMVSSIVGNNSHRKLDIDEFRGFVLADDLAPLIFINGADSKAAQMFTLAHELAHLWLGSTGVSDPQAGHVPDQQTEHWCNRVAAELLMPLRELRAVYQPDMAIEQEIQRLAREFKVSTLVALRRLHDLGIIDQEQLQQHYRRELARLRALERRRGDGGDYYRSLGARASKRFAHALVSNALEGQTLFQDAFHLLDVRKTKTFFEFARKLGVTA